MQGIDGNFSHLIERLGTRVSRQDKDVFYKAVNGLMGRIKAKRVPSVPWYRTVKRNNTPVGYICGQGVYVSTVLSKDMVPKGKEI